MRTIEWRTKVRTPLSYNILSSFIRQRRWKHQLIFWDFFFYFVFCSFLLRHLSCVLFKTCFQLLSIQGIISIFDWVVQQIWLRPVKTPATDDIHYWLLSMWHSTHFTNNKAERTSFFICCQHILNFSILMQELEWTPLSESILLVKRVKRTKIIITMRIDEVPVLTYVCIELVRRNCHRNRFDHHKRRWDWRNGL